MSVPLPAVADEAPNLPNGYPAPHVVTFSALYADGEHLTDLPATLRSNVTSPGGTTQAALAVFESRGVKVAIVDATGKLLAEQIATGHIPQEIRPFDPRR